MRRITFRRKVGRGFATPSRVIYMARQLGHDARLTLTRDGHVIDELEDMPRIEAEAAIADARTERCSDSAGAA